MNSLKVFPKDYHGDTIVMTTDEDRTISPWVFGHIPHLPDYFGYQADFSKMPFGFYCNVSSPFLFRLWADTELSLKTDFQENFFLKSKLRFKQDVNFRRYPGDISFGYEQKSIAIDDKQERSQTLSTGVSVWSGKIRTWIEPQLVWRHDVFENEFQTFGFGLDVYKRFKILYFQLDTEIEGLYVNRQFEYGLNLKHSEHFNLFGNGKFVEFGFGFYQYQRYREWNASVGFRLWN